MLRFLTAGESHGKGLVVIIEGLPSGLEITEADIQGELSRRRLGFGRGPRMRFEQDDLTLLSGIRHGKTIGSPISIVINNTEWPKWQEEMSPAPGTPSKVLTSPRPGHADLAGMQKYDLNDARDVLERASARETAARVAAGACAKVFLKAFGVRILSHVTALGSVSIEEGAHKPSFDQLAQIDENDVRCAYPQFTQQMVAEVKAAAKVGDSLGGVAEVLATGVPVGLGSHIQWDRKLDSLIAQALMSIQAIKAVEIGEGISVASKRGSVGHDSISWSEDSNTYMRNSHLAGGIEGGISTGSMITAKLWMKPLATLSRPVLETVDVVTKESTVSFRERTDVTAVPAMGVVAEAMLALVLANEMLRKFGGDSMNETASNLESFKESLKDGLGGV